MRVVSFLVAGPWLADAFFSFAPPTAVAANTRRPVNSGTRIHTGHGSGSLGRAGAVPGAAAAESESPESLLASSEGVAGAEAPEQITVEGGGAAESESPDSLPASLDGIAGAEALESSTIKGAESTRPDWWAEDAGVDDTLSGIFRETMPARQPGEDAFIESTPEPEVPEFRLRLSDLIGSEWKIGILWRDSTKVDVSWFRLKDEGVVEWGFTDTPGIWGLEQGQYITVSREFAPFSWAGKRLFCAGLESPAYIEGIIKGWGPWFPAGVMGQWQAIRLGVNRTEYGTPEWDDYSEDDLDLRAELDQSTGE